MQARHFDCYQTSCTAPETTQIIIIKKSRVADLESLLTDPSGFPELFSNGLDRANGVVKPVIIITNDGGPDTNVRYDKTIACHIDLFRKHNLQFENLRFFIFL